MSNHSGAWQTVALADVADIESGGTPSTAKPEYWIPEIDWVTAKDVSEAGLAKIYQTERRISSLGLRNSPAKILPALTTVLIARGATMGKCRMLARPMAMNQTCYGIVARDDTDPLFLYYSLSNLYEHFRSVAHGSVFDTIIRAGLLSLPLTIPPLPTQRRIAEILGRLDDKIEVNRRINRALERMAQALYKHWFVDFGPFQDGEFVESEVGLAPRGWKIRRLGDVVKLTSGRSYRSSELTESSVALVTLKSFERGGGYKRDGLKAYSGPFKDAQVIEPGEVIIACTDITQNADVIGKPALVQPDARYEKLIASLDCLVVRPNLTGLTSAYLNLLFSMSSFQDYTRAHSNGSTVLHLQKGAIPEFRFVSPPLELLDSFGQKVSRVFEQVAARELENVKLAATRDYLLPRLLAGEVI